MKVVQSMSREMKDSGIEWIGEIPEEWNVVKIKNMATDEKSLLMDGDWIESNVIRDEGIRYLTTGNIGSGIYKEQGNGFISEETFKQLKCLEVFSGDLVISRLNEPIGRACIIPDTYYHYVVAVDNVVLRPDKEYDKKYLMYCMNIEGYNHMVKLASRGTTMPRISRSILGSFELPVPSTIEQRQIANYLDNKVSQIDTIIQKQTQLIEQYKTYKQCLITETVTKGLNPNVEMKDSGIEWIGMIPKHWKVVRIKTLFREVNERNEDESALLLSLFTAIGVRPRNEMEDKGNKAVTVIGYKKVQVGDLIVNKLLAWMGAIAYSDYEGVTSPDYDVYRALMDANVVQEYYNMYFRYTNFKDDCYRYGRGIMMMRWRTYPEQFKNIFVVNPPREEQEAITLFLKNKCVAIDKLIEAKQSLIQQLESYKKSLIYECVTGKREIPDTYGAVAQATLEEVAATLDKH